MYEIYLIDIDNTLLDFDAAEIHSFHSLLSSYGIAYEDELFFTYKKINKNLWNLLEEGKIDNPTVRRERFNQFFHSLGLSVEADEAEKKYQSYLCNKVAVMPYSKEVLSSLKLAGKKLYTASNGMYETQVKRLQIAGLYEFFEKIFVSDVIGFEKPDKNFFNHCFHHMKDFERSKTIMIGDSITADIQGALNSDIASCLYDPKGNFATSKATYTISSLRELLSLPKKL